MLQNNPLSKLYPHLNFSRISNPSMNRSKSADSAPKSILRHTETENVLEKNDKNDIPPKTVTISVPEPPPKPIESPPLVEAVKEIETKRKLLPRRPKPEPKPTPERETVIPKKGENGLQPKYTLEQKRQIYLNKIARKSVKIAQKEVEAVNEVLNTHNFSTANLVAEERSLKNKLKLINSAKFFTTDKMDNNSINESVPTSLEKEEGLRSAQKRAGSVDTERNISAE